MPDSEIIERQVRRVRRRRNLVELQRALYLAVATASGGAAVLLLLALASSARLFAVVSWSIAGAVLVTVALLAVEARQRWLGGARAAAWIDRRSGLRGRLTTLLELAARARAAQRGAPGAGRTTSGASTAPLDAGDARRPGAFFLPLLVEENLRRLSLWSPERLVPRRLPIAALAAALAALGMLLVVVAIAPGLRPHEPEILYSDDPIDGVEMDSADGVPDRVVIAPRGERRERGREVAGGGGGAGAAEDPSALARLSGDLQERIRRELWGKAWERMRDAMEAAERARAGRAPGAGGSGDDEAPGDEEQQDETFDGEGEDARLASGRAARPRGPGQGAARSFRRRDAAPDGEATEEEGDGARGAAGDDGIAAGAGNDTDPEGLFGAPADGGGASGDVFELALSAPVRARRGGPRPPQGAPPPAGADGRPELGQEQRDAAPTHRMAVPPAYEAIVREVFAHRASQGEGRP